MNRNADFRERARLITIPGYSCSETEDDHGEIHETPTTLDAIAHLLSAAPPDLARPACRAGAACPTSSTAPLAGTSVAQLRLARVIYGEATSTAPIDHVHVIDGSSAAAFELVWSGSSFSLTLVDPSGRVIDPAVAEQDPNIEYAAGGGGAAEFTAIYTITDPVPGVWTMRVTAGPEVDPEGSPFRTISMSAGPVELAVAVSTETAVPGEPVTITATVDAGTSRVTGAIVSASVHDRDGLREDVVMADDGLDPDLAADDGVYTGRATVTGVAGIHAVDVVADGLRPDGQAFARTAVGSFDVSTATARLEGVYADHLVDEDGVAGAEALAIDVQITVDQPGSYILTGSLTSLAGAAIGDATFADEAWPVGTRTVTLRFEGAAIREIAQDGPYVLQSIRLVGTDQGRAPCDAATDAYQTAAYLAADFAIHDLDGDGRADGADNCMTIPNLDQADSDGDLAGDACDNCPDLPNGDQSNLDDDSFGDACDLCPTTAEAFQSDVDGDGSGDACDPDADGDGILNASDCAPVDPLASSAPVEVGGLRFSSASTLAWDPALVAGNVTYDVVRGVLGVLHSSGGRFADAVCLVQRTAATEAADALLSPPAEGFYYLVRSRTGCGTGTYGTGTGGERTVPVCP